MTRKLSDCKCCKLMPLSTGSFYCHHPSSKIHTLMTRPRIIQVISFSWVLPVSFNVLKVILLYVLYQNNSCPRFYLAEYYFLPVPTTCCLNALLCINDISRTQAWSVSTHRSRAVTFSKRYVTFSRAVTLLIRCRLKSITRGLQ